MKHITKHPKDADTHLILKLPDINGKSYDAYLGTWDISVWVSPKRISKVEYRDGEARSIGEIPTTIKINEKDIELFIKSSKVQFGQGPLLCKMSIYADNDYFIDKIQVIKTFTKKTCIEIE